MKNYITRPLISKPGIQRDGTPFASQSYIDGQWCRFYMGRPRKIGGYQLIDIGNTEIIRSLFGVPQNNSVDVYLGRASSVNYNNFDFNGVGSGEIDRTPSGYVPDENNIWNFALFTDNNGDQPGSQIVASVIPNGADVSNTTNGPLYYGNTDTTSPLQPIYYEDGTTPVMVSGGIVALPTVMVAFGNNGLVQWSNIGDTTKWSTLDNIIVDNTKVIKAFPTRGSTAQQLIVWTLSSVLNLTYDATNKTFSSSTIQDNITVMSPNSIIEYNQQFFWVGIDQFYFFNGIVQRLDNSMSTDWFFQNINLNERSKVWGMVIPRYKELWWFYPRNTIDPVTQEVIFTATECNACVIYNTELNVWYDSMITRAAGLSPGIFPYPLMSDSQKETVPSGRGVVNNYGLWMHEFGFDQIISGIPLAIDSFFETHIITLFENNPENNRLIRTRRIEPDLAQIGDMAITVNNRMFPSDTIENSQLIQTGPFTFTPNTQKIDNINSQGRLVSFVFDSNTIGGVYQAGQTLLDYEIGDVQPGSN